MQSLYFHKTHKTLTLRLYGHYETSRDGSCDYMSFLKAVVSTQLPIKSPSASPTQALVIFEEAAAEKRAEKEMEELATEQLWCQTVPLVEVEIKLRNKVSRVIIYNISIIHTSLIKKAGPVQNSIRDGKMCTYSTQPLSVLNN